MPFCQHTAKLKHTIRCQYSLNFMTLNAFSNLKDSMIQIIDAGYMNTTWILMRVGFLFIYFAMHVNTF